MKKLVFAILLLSAPAFAQQQQQATPNEQALSAKLIMEIQSGLSCSSNAVVLNVELVKLREEIKSLKEKLEGKKDQ